MTYRTFVAYLSTQSTVS